MRNFIAVLLVIMVSAGCATRDEKARNNISNTWRISKVFQNGNDVTESYLESRVDYRISFTRSGAFQENYAPFSGGEPISISGNWVFSDGINKITLTDANLTRVYQVDELSEDNFNITDQGSSNGREIQFVPA